MANTQIEAIRLALDAFEDLRDNHGIHYVNEIVDLRHILANQALEQQPCKYPNCPYPCPDLPDCKDTENLYDLAKKAENGGQP